MSCKPKVYAHKGGNVGVPENTLAAFRKSLNIGADGIEIDVHRCKSGELVVIHEPWLHVTANGVGHVGDHTLEQLRQLTAGANEKIPLLSEVLQLIDGRLILNIEIKNSPRQYPGIEHDVIRELSAYQHPESIVISSFDHELLRRIYRLTRRYELGLLLNGMLVDVGDYAAAIGARFYHPQLGNLLASHVAAAQAGGLQVNAWTLNKVEEWQRAVDMGVDGIVTDDPEGCLRFLAAIDFVSSQPAPSRRKQFAMHLRRALLKLARAID